MKLALRELVRGWRGALLAGLEWLGCVVLCAASVAAVLLIFAVVAV